MRWKNLVGGGNSNSASPLRQATFRRVWVSSIFSNLGQQVQAVSAAWSMLQITQNPAWVASVQTASMLPIMLFAIPAGAIADMYDRRKVAIGALVVSLIGALSLSLVARAGLLSPSVIFAACFAVGSGIAVYGPAWQASAAEMVGPEALPAAVALYSTSSNVARSFGPALGGGIIASFGIFAAFSVNAALYVPIIIALYLWRRQATPPRLPPERLDRSIIAGLRFVRHAPPIRRILVRTLGLSIGGAATYSMMPLVARRLLHGGPGTYGVLLGAFGIGAVTAALNIGTIRRYHEPDRIVAFSGVAMGGAILVAAVSRFMPLTAFAMMIGGAGWLLSLTQFNVSLQLFAPRWVSGRAVATFQSVCAAGLAGGAWLWGHTAQAIGVENALLCAAAWMMLVPLLCWLLPIARIDPTETLAITPSGDPVVLLDITGRSGPIVLEIDYSVDPQNARKFYHLIRQIQRRRERDGAYDVSIARDLENPAHWIERFQYPTWHDYLRSRDRATVADRSMREEVQALQRSPEFPRAQRFLERPFGSVRWRDDAHDTGTEKPGSLGVLH